MSLVSTSWYKNSAFVLLPLELALYPTKKDWCALLIVFGIEYCERKEAPDANKTAARQRSLCFAATKRVRSTSSLALKADC
jgi:hypothetical protein